jgi:hypothetical protein
MHIITLIKFLITLDIFELFLFCFFILPWLLGLAVICAIILTLYSNWLWKGMDNEDRYYYIKQAKW